ncbi:Imm45 family immunity protein [Capnocytophaga sp.]|uniref:Imm45 family immunity protein n=1 Tax=Capnocytophaga sp. TaxID=44737 RepID=UPI0026DC8F02|nr:Imm45 family immunity protein [Capnocytophaga sp.]MDO5105248.1 Imm45 family immunity protein [Capnocytophaga sp.]
MTKLIDYQEENIFRGAKFRCKGAYPYENIVDFLLCDLFGELGLVVCTGYKAGLVFCVFPSEALSKDKTTFAIETQWLKENWHKWGYFECPLEEVLIL